MHQAIIHRAEQLFTSPSIQSFHDGPLWWCFGWVGGCVCVQEGGLGFPLPPTQDFVIQFSRAPSFECKRWNPNYELTCIGMTQKKLVVLLGWVELSWDFVCWEFLFSWVMKTKCVPLFIVQCHWILSEFTRFDWLNKDNWIHWFTRQPVWDQWTPPTFCNNKVKSYFNFRQFRVESR